MKFYLALLPAFVFFLAGMKLTGRIDLSWWVVFSPAIAPLAIALALAVVHMALELLDRHLARKARDSIRELLKAHEKRGR